MMRLLAFRNFLYKPWRSALLFFGFGMGVAVMIVLLAIGEAMVTQAHDERLVGGGDVTVLPEGIDIEVMKTGGLGGLYFSIPNARFLYLQLLASPRLADVVGAVAPESEDKLLYVTTPDGVERTARGLGEIPSLSTAVGSPPAVSTGAWTDDEGDRRWMRPTPAELEMEIDHFHVPGAGLAHRISWAEWHYFNILSADRRRWTFISYILAGGVGDGSRGWGGQVLVTTHDATEPGGPARQRSFVATALPGDIAFSTTSADLRIGASRVTVRRDGRYAITAQARELGGDAVLNLDLLITPAPGGYFPGAAIESGDFESGYVVPALVADASGAICIARECERYDSVQAYHDHNWGVWRGVSWEWGAARLGRFGILYGRVQPPDSLGGSAPLFVYLVDSLGFRAVFRPQRIDYVDGRTIMVEGHPRRVPSRATLMDTRGADTLRLELTIEDAVATDTRGRRVERGASTDVRRLAHPYFVQMKGRAQMSGRVDGVPVSGEGTGFFETYR
jgi:hypothetical protein